MEKEKQSVFTENELFKPSGWAASATVLIACCFGVDYALVTAFAIIVVSLWCKWNYNKGKYDQVVDEHERDGYPEFGLERMQKSLYVLMGIASLVLVALSIVKLFN